MRRRTIDPRDPQELIKAAAQNGIHLSPSEKKKLQGLLERERKHKAAYSDVRQRIRVLLAKAFDRNLA